MSKKEQYDKDNYKKNPSYIVGLLEGSIKMALVELELDMPRDYTAKHLQDALVQAHTLWEDYMHNQYPNSVVPPTPAT